MWFELESTFSEIKSEVDFFARFRYFLKNPAKDYSYNKKDYLKFGWLNELPAVSEEWLYARSFCGCSTICKLVCDAYFLRFPGNQRESFCLLNDDENGNGTAGVAAVGVESLSLGTHFLMQEIKIIKTLIFF